MLTSLCSTFYPIVATRDAFDFCDVVFESWRWNSAGVWDSVRRCWKLLMCLSVNTCNAFAFCIVIFFSYLLKCAFCSHGWGLKIRFTLMVNWNEPKQSLLCVLATLGTLQWGFVLEMLLEEGEQKSNPCPINFFFYNSGTQSRACDRVYKWAEGKRRWKAAEKRRLVLNVLSRVFSRRYFKSVM